MTKQEFMNQLAYLLQDISVSEREEALDFYAGYFDDAGVENEASVVQQLESPEKVAATIKSGLAGFGSDSGEYTEAGYEDARFREEKKVPEPAPYQNQTREPWTNRPLIVVLTVVLAVVILNTVLNIIGGLAGTAFGLIGAVLTLAFGAIFLCLGLLLGGVVLFVIGIITLFSNLTVGIASCGIGLIMLALGLMMTIFVSWFYLKLAPRCIRSIADMFRRISKKGGDAS